MAKRSKGDTFFIAFFEKDGETTGYSVATDPSNIHEPMRVEAKTDTVEIKNERPNDFEAVLREFIRAMESFRNFIPMTFSFAPFMLKAIVGQKLTKFAHSRGKSRPDLSKGELHIFELNAECFRELRMITDEIQASLQGTKILPELGVVGLVSAYDAFLANLLKAVFTRHQEIFFTSQKQIPLSDLIKFASIDEAKESLLEREIEGVIRLSHHEQFAWMEKNLDLPLRTGLKVWPEFVELCERRNLLTHTGGFTSKQYLSVCEHHKIITSGIVVGERLNISSEYYERAVAIIYEIGVKLCYVLWRKFATSEVNKADLSLSEHCYNLIYNGQYTIAEAILRFAVEVKGEREEGTRSRMIINLANALRLQGRVQDAKTILKKKDWSGSSRELKLGVAAVSEDVASVIQLMREIGSKGDINAEQYRTWPIFRGIRERDEFGQAFRSIFKESLIKPTDTVQTAETVEAVINQSSPTKH